MTELHLKSQVKALYWYTELQVEFLFQNVLNLYYNKTSCVAS